MTVSSIVWELISIVLIAVGAVILAIILLGVLVRLFKLNSLKFRPEKIQKPELVKKKNFETIDGYKLRWYGEINPTGKVILLCIHDINRNRKDFDDLNYWMLKQDKNISVVSYDQRYTGENLRIKKKI